MFRKPEAILGRSIEGVTPAMIRREHWLRFAPQVTDKPPREVLYHYRPRNDSLSFAKNPEYSFGIDGESPVRNGGYGLQIHGTKGLAKDPGAIVQCGSNLGLERSSKPPAPTPARP